MLVFARLRRMWHSIYIQHIFHAQHISGNIFLIHLLFLSIICSHGFRFVQFAHLSSLFYTHIRYYSYTLSLSLSVFVYNCVAYQHLSEAMAIYSAIRYLYSIPFSICTRMYVGVFLTLWRWEQRIVCKQKRASNKSCKSVLLF